MDIIRYILGIAIVLVVIASVPYIVYLFGIKYGKKIPAIPIYQNLPKISIIMSAYNEEEVLEKRIKNLADQDYPKNKYEVIFVNDFSEDNTLLKSETEFIRHNIKYALIHNSKRIGTNKSYNLAIPLAKYDIIVTTDADVFFKHDALTTLISRLISSDNIAAVCADLKPVSSETSVTKLETTYRGIYGKMCEWESACDSTYNFNGALVAFKKNLISRIEDGHGSDDANTAFESIRKGYRSIYEPRSIVYEELPKNFSYQFRQKTRRAKRLIEATLYNLDLLKVSRSFRWFYVLRIWMFCISPISYVTGIGLIFITLLLSYPVYLVIFPFAMLSDTVAIFSINQIYLVSGLLHLKTNTKIWTSTSQYYKDRFTCDETCIYRERYDHGYGCLGWCVIKDEPVISNVLCNKCLDKKM
jgi:cellulose synthase/poly-beta-1,6-N-acetylglucosamine synthase-like glycosyltransferase